VEDDASETESGIPLEMKRKKREQWKLLSFHHYSF